MILFVEEHKLLSSFPIPLCPFILRYCILLAAFLFFRNAKPAGVLFQSFVKILLVNKFLQKITNYIESYLPNNTLLYTIIYQSKISVLKQLKTLQHVSIIIQIIFREVVGSLLRSLDLKVF
jgi:hypothetical protein